MYYAKNLRDIGNSNSAKESVCDTVIGLTRGLKASVDI